MAAKEATDRDRLGAAMLVAIVVGVGLVIGALVGLAFRSTPGHPGPGPPPGVPPGVGLLYYALSVTDLALLLSLLYVYGRTYADTRAPFALGLLVFLVALTLQTAVTSPLVFHVLGLGPGGLWPILFASFAFGTVALAIFLYLSLE